MYVQQLKLPLTPGADAQALFEEVEVLLGSYYQHGQIQGRWSQPLLGAGAITAQLLTLEADALAPEHNGPYVAKSLARLRALGQEPEVGLLGVTEPGYAGACRCAHRPYYILFTHCLSLASPVRCGGGHGAVPLYRLPADLNRHALLSWQTSYQACDDLQLQVAVGERWATRQLSDPRSALSQWGRQLAAHLEELSGVPAYYYLFNYRRLSRARDQQRPCPLCGQPWTLPEPRHGLYDFCCAPDRLLSSVTPNN